VSALSFGMWATFGDKSDLSGEEGVKMAMDCMRVARKHGVNFFDNAETYGNPTGAAEVIFGKALKRLQDEDPVMWRRGDLVISTKIFWGRTAEFGGATEYGLSRKHLMEGLDASLERIGLKYVDCVFCHRFDPLTPTESVVRHMTDVVRSGRALSWGTSEWSAQRLTEAYWIAQQSGLEPPAFEQPQFNMFHRERVEEEYKALYSRPYNLGTTIWSPLASGLLTGKYNDGIPEGSRLATKGYEWLVTRLEEWKQSGKIDKVKQLTQYAQDNFDATVSQLSIAWCVKKGVTTVLLGASKPEQLEHNFGALEVFSRLTEVHMKEIDDIIKSKPKEWEPLYRSINLG